MLRVKYFESLYGIMWDNDDDFYRFFRNHNPFRYNRSHTFDLDKFFNNTYPSPFTSSNDEYNTPSKFKATKYVTITVSEGDNEGIDKAIKLLESMRSKSSDPVEAAKSDKEDLEDKFDKDFTEENL